MVVRKGIVEANGGKIWAKNNRDDGKGTTFTFTLPIMVCENCTLPLFFKLIMRSIYLNTCYHIICTLRAPEIQHNWG
jgi:hypothetical protein